MKKPPEGGFFDAKNLFLGRWQVSTTAMRYFSGHANALSERRMRVNGFADVDGICAHLDGQRHFTNHVACMCAHHTAAQDLSVTMGFG